ncbi:MAG: BadF/BadG/BcrA/BcrD ATPase family, partial [Haloplasmataceae bacterium]|nr:BadF/BadG/BcrA/BcrD ATPase family [Haloplasmataceae bacterium]
MFFVGVDGGGTNTRVCVLNEKKEILGIAKTGPSSIDTVDITETIHNIKKGLEQVINVNNLKNP